MIASYGVPDDVDAGVSARMRRQQVLYQPGHRFHFVLAQQALRTKIGDDDTMAGQLDRLLSIMSMGTIRLGIIPAGTPYTVPTNQFIIFDERLVHVETISAEITVTQPREIALYQRAFTELADAAVYGAAVRALVMPELNALQPDR